MARRWPDVRSNAVEPGFVATKMGGPAGIAEKVFRILHLEPGSTAANVLAPALQAIQAAK